MSKYEITSVAQGHCVRLRSVHDAVFSQKMAGEGCALIPSKGEFFVPVNGTIKLVFRGLHAYVIEDEHQNNILIHIGVNTLALNGAGFSTYVTEGQTVRQGDLMVKIDDDTFNDSRLDFTTMVLMMKPDLVDDLFVKDNGKVSANETVILSYTPKNA